MRGLLDGAARKTGWQRAEEAAARPPRAIQRGLDRSVWDADAVRDERRAAVMAAVGAPDGVLVVDEPGFLKQGTQSAAVPRQHSGTAGRIANGQIGVFRGSASSTGRAGRDRALYLPQEWADGPDRRAVAGIPAAGRFQPTPPPARRMLERARDPGVPAAWVTAAAGYGNASAFRAALAARGQAYVGGAAPAHDEHLAAVCAAQTSPGRGRGGGHR
ncbi:MAG TPA: transposase [Vicinamibacteria bacterium]|nr:transposase [Vicinamibacteria bacterium]